MNFDLEDLCLHLDAGRLVLARHVRKRLVCVIIIFLSGDETPEPAKRYHRNRRKRANLIYYHRGNFLLSILSN